MRDSSSRELPFHRLSRVAWVNVGLAIVAVATAATVGCRERRDVAPNAVSRHVESDTEESNSLGARADSSNAVTDSTATSAGEIATESRLVESASDATRSPDAVAVGEATDGDVQTINSETAAGLATDVPETPIPVERLLLLSPGGPLIVDIAISIAGRPFADVQAATMAELLPLADSDGDGQTTWEEMFAHPQFRYGQFGNPATTTYQNQQEMVRIYDTARNGRVDPDELPRYLTSNSGTSNSFSLRTSNYHREFNCLNSPTMAWLDADGDHVLSAREIDQAAGRLRTRDQDLDEVLLPGDMANEANPRTTRATSYGPMAAHHLTAGTEWYDLLYDIRELYATSGDVSSSDFALVPELFAQIDGNNDGRWDVEELAGLADVESHVALAVSLDIPSSINLASPANDSTDANGGPLKRPSEPFRVQVTGIGLPIEAVEQHVSRTPGRTTLVLQGATFDLFVLDAIGENTSEQTARTLLRGGDVNGDLYLDSEEFTNVQGQVGVPFEGIDLDGNKMVFVEELQAVLRQRNQIARGQVVVAADDQADALFCALDRDADGRLDGREIASVARSLLMLDLNSDGQLHWSEIPGAMAIGVTRGNVGDLNALQLPVSIAPRSDSVPRWFQGMDRNNDGAISLREFLGSREQFQTLDVNRDGFVDSGEIAELASPSASPLASPGAAD